jgi:hypothetical protein
MTFNPEYKLIPVALHNALLTVPATKADCATEMIATEPLTLSQAAVERAIDLIIQDLFDEMILTTTDYAALLARHQLADPAVALRVIKATSLVILLEREREVNQQIIDDSTAEWVALSQPQKDAIPNIKAAGDEGILGLTARNAEIDAHLLSIENKRKVI